MGELLLLWGLQPELVHGQTVSRGGSTHLPGTEAGEQKQRLSPVPKSMPLGESAFLRDSSHSFMNRHYESLRKKMIGKPYSGKPNVRFDEGELEIELSATTPALYSTESVKLALGSAEFGKNEESLL